jgi:hypothetical protein
MFNLKLYQKENGAMVVTNGPLRLEFTFEGTLINSNIGTGHAGYGYAQDMVNAEVSKRRNINKI